MTGAGNPIETVLSSSPADYSPLMGGVGEAAVRPDSERRNWVQVSYFQNRVFQRLARCDLHNSCWGFLIWNSETTAKG